MFYVIKKMLSDLYMVRKKLKKKNRKKDLNKKIAYKTRRFKKNAPSKVIKEREAIKGIKL